MDNFVIEHIKVSKLHVIRNTRKYVNWRVSFKTIQVAEG